MKTGKIKYVWLDTEKPILLRMTIQQNGIDGFIQCSCNTRYYHTGKLWYCTKGLESYKSVLFFPLKK